RSLTNQFKALAVARPSVALPSAAARPSAAPSTSFSAMFSPLFPQLQLREKGYKLKTKSAVKKRFTKTRERIRRLGQPVYVQGKIRKNILNMLHN
ncbi:TPA: hypothetical protein N0F65_005110, partial [Lagenidium giganteum]